MFRLSHDGQPFEAKVHIPEMKIDANYTSSGVLIVLPASGGGTFHANLGEYAYNAIPSPAYPMTDKIVRAPQESKLVLQHDSTKYQLSSLVMYI